MKISIDTSQPLSDIERDLLAALLGGKREPVSDDGGKLSEEVATTTGDAVKNAVDRARELVRSGDAATVSAGLQSVGAERVSAMTPEQAEKFLEEVS